MDRLVCGDVGFGKTEVAIRAAFKAVQDGQQVAVLVPDDGARAAALRDVQRSLGGLPGARRGAVAVPHAGQAKQVVDGIKGGEVDIVIGTHRLLSEDMHVQAARPARRRRGAAFRRQPQGARSRSCKTDVDVLTLTATPIPRTLEMSLTGIRDLTLLNTPPADRQPILTYVGEYDERAVAEAIRRELLREGQVFFVHNRVQDIDDGRRRAARARARGARHGRARPDGRGHARADRASTSGRASSTCSSARRSSSRASTCPTVNTIVVDRADMLGLGQLHQLRGRVGRAGQRAYAYLFHPADRVLTRGRATSGCSTIGEATELGSGFKIAMRDLEIRGAGNLLGESQSGHIAAVGYDLYCQMVTEAVAELKGEEVREPAEVKLDLPIDAHLPPTTWAGRSCGSRPTGGWRRSRPQAEVDDIRAEWVDRYGPPPAPAEALLAVARLRAECAPARHPGGHGRTRHGAAAAVEAEDERRGALPAAGGDGVYKPDQEEIQVRARCGRHHGRGRGLPARAGPTEDTP